jgi:CDP-diacylglycerol--serine O-phosphatidyltransferase
MINGKPKESHMKQIPNLFTLLNLVFGCLAIIYILQSGEVRLTVNDEDAILNLPEKIWWGSICIGIAAVIDFLDGFVARLFKATSTLGKELDSLADIVSFGVAPGMILFQLLRITFIQQVNGLDVSTWALIPAILFPCAGAFRLARFNTASVDESGFTGVPIPAAGLVVASLPLIIWYNDYNLTSIILNKWFLYLVTLLLSYLMISKLPLMALKFTDFSVRNNLSKFILLALSVIAALLLKWLAVPVIFILYILLSVTMRERKPQPVNDSAI